ncbi:MAG: hypothetical protein PHC53_02350 [Patescibacteria group bacterium]|nr:hypothetical protein [Patescibacteria group bacterium]
MTVDERGLIGDRMVYSVILASLGGVLLAGIWIQYYTHFWLACLVCFLAILLLEWSVQIARLAIKLVKSFVLRARRKSTRGREFLLLLDKDVRHGLFGGYAGTKTLLAAFALLLFLALSPVFYFLVGGPTGWTFAGSCLTGSTMMSVFLLYKLGSSRKTLLPIYHQRQQTKAQAEHEAAIQAFNSMLPEDDYRSWMPPRASRDTVDELRVRIAEQRLPPELIPVAQHVAQTQTELMEAEADLAASNPQPAEAKTT